MSRRFSNDPRPPSYKMAHHLVWKTYGSAKQYSCTACGKPAKCWGYQHNGGDKELVDEHGFVYALGLEYYASMCRKCHDTLDECSKKARELRQQNMSPERKKRIEETKRRKTPEEISTVRRKAAQVANSKRYSCASPGCTVANAHAAGIGAHQKASGHVGKIPIPTAFRR